MIIGRIDRPLEQLKEVAAAVARRQMNWEHGRRRRGNMERQTGRKEEKEDGRKRKREKNNEEEEGRSEKGEGRARERPHRE